MTEFLINNQWLAIAAGLRTLPRKGLALWKAARAEGRGRRDR